MHLSRESDVVQCEEDAREIDNFLNIWIPQNTNKLQHCLPLFLLTGMTTAILLLEYDNKALE